MLTFSQSQNSKEYQVGNGQVWYRVPPNQDAPMKEQTIEDYRLRMLAVLVHIQRHLDSDLSLEELADVANFSPFHFHRLFHGLVGESIREHVCRLRL
jgi:transcriptional regulator GlxA family with amidase domain